MRKILLLTCILLAVAAALPATASVWCGENGIIRFSFVEGDSLVSVWDSGPAEAGVTKVDLYAWLTDVESVQHEGEVLMAIGGYELNLKITGAEAYILSQEFPAPGFNVGRKQGSIVYGLGSGLSVARGSTQLVHWKLMFTGRPENVRFDLESEGLQSCMKTEGCTGSGTHALYVGATSTHLLDMLSGAGYEPAWLNPAGEVDQTPVVSAETWRKVGVYGSR
ncbi:hypothetical protein GW813_04065 [bacterium]|nr:hypothetical protein [bacterium]PIV80460.1 MAG: hypothetical protein COW53_09560 [bacterium CG17_big_fil_post_rev_8_21_14_2_50_64_8]PJA73308.1 MAG: hypothetical protein CO151_14080 [bacterium CG_4_9_14_3_um_filter_65_15]